MSRSAEPDASILDQIHAGDCVAGLRELPPGCIDLVFADPPFNIGYDYESYDDNRSDDEYLDWTDCWARQVVRVLKPAGSLWVAIGDEYAAEFKVLLTRVHGLTLRNWVVWYYTFGVHCTHKFTRSHVHLLYLVKDPRRFTFNANDPGFRVPSARQAVYGDSRAAGEGRIPDDTWILRPQAIPGAFQPDEDTWFIPRVNGTFRERSGWHGCQMPEQLLGRIVRVCSNPGEIVLDPFVGSGTTLAVAKKLGRRFLGFEISAEYVTGARQRIESVSDGDPLQGSENPLLSRPPGTAARIRDCSPDQLDLFG
jgi:site-specific DNA-methyltransferase (adenine-specific)